MFGSDEDGENLLPVVIVMVTTLWVSIYFWAWCGRKQATLCPQKPDFKTSALVNAVIPFRRAHYLLVAIQILPNSIALPNTIQYVSWDGSKTGKP